MQSKIYNWYIYLFTFTANLHILLYIKTAVTMFCFLLKGWLPAALSHYQLNLRQT